MQVVRGVDERIPVTADILENTPQVQIVRASLLKTNYYHNTVFFYSLDGYFRIPCHLV
mgnify:CR=1 FL=1